MVDSQCSLARCCYLLRKGTTMILGRDDSCSHAAQLLLVEREMPAREVVDQTLEAHGKCGSNVITISTAPKSAPMD